MISKPVKSDVVMALLHHGHEFFTHVINDDNVVLPPHLDDSTYIILAWGKDLPTPIPDLEVTSEGISGTLSFKGEEFYCFVPWENIYGVLTKGNKGVVWYHPQMPDDLTTQCSPEDTFKAQTIKIPETGDQYQRAIEARVSLDRMADLKSSLTVVNGGRTLPVLEKNRGHLRLVK